jgi:DNA-binding NtrC family response regulator
MADAPAIRVRALPSDRENAAVARPFLRAEHGPHIATGRYGKRGGTVEIDLPATRLDVLVVDDNEDTADGVRDILSHDHDVRVVHDLDSAFAEVARSCPDVVVCDLNLGTRVGSDLLEHLALTHPRVLRILMTGAEPQKWKALVTRNVAQLALRKPFSIDALLNAVETVLPTTAYHGRGAHDDDDLCTALHQSIARRSHSPRR